MSLCKTSDYLCETIVWSQGQNVNNLAEGPLNQIKNQPSKT